MLYPQPSKEQFFKEMIRDGVMKSDYTVVDKHEYMHWLERKKHAIIQEIATEFPEFGNYDRYAYDQKTKELDLIQQMMASEKPSTSDTTQQKLADHENELLNTPSVFMRAVEMIGKLKQKLPIRMPQNETKR